MKKIFIQNNKQDSKTIIKPDEKAQHVVDEKRKSAGSRGFTLAEILIALGIVGVVAVLTIPSVMKNYKNRMFTSQLEKVYSQIANATDAIMSDDQTDNFYETKAGRAAAQDESGEYTAGPPYFLNTYFKTLKKNCKDSATEPCAKSTAGTYKTIYGTAVGGIGGNSYCIQTVNGATICSFFNSTNTCMSVLVDVNGLDGPNVAGRDIFSMDIHRNGTISDYSSACADNSFGAPASSCTLGATTSLYDAASGCLTSVIESGWKMEY